MNSPHIKTTAMPKDYRAQDFLKLIDMIDNHELMKNTTAPPLDFQKLRTPQYRTKCVMRASLEDIVLGINLCKIQLGESGAVTTDFDGQAEPTASKQQNSFIKIILRKTENIVLYEQRSTTALRDSEEGRLVQADNDRYKAILAGVDKSRRTVNAETQTISALKKSRIVNTESLFKNHVASYVSNFEMFDTYNDLEQITKNIDVDGRQTVQITTCKVNGRDQFSDIIHLPNFQLATMITMRILASNVYETQQRRFRNMQKLDPLAVDVKFKYSLRLLWRLNAPTTAQVTKAVSDISFCPNNGDIMAVAYGIFTDCHATCASNVGYVYVWNIKNPVNPERCYAYEVPVMTIEFSPFMPQLLAIGLYDGSVQVRDISKPELAPLAISQKARSPSYEPITDIKWITKNDGDIGGRDIEPFLAISRSGIVTKYRLLNGPYLLAYPQNQLQRVEGKLEGIDVSRKSVPLQANRQAQALALILDPIEPDIYFVLSNEGIMYKCSTNYPQQHLALQQVHDTSAIGMEFSPWSPKLYLTCGNDWCVRIWLVGIFQPLITLQHHLTPILCAHWSHTHSTILVSLSRSTVDIWDLRNNILRPVSSTTIDTKIFYTTFEFSHCGRSLAVGNEAGNVLMLALEDIPFPPHFQYKQLKHAIFKALAMKPTIKQQVKSLGHFSYPNFNKKK